MACNCSQSACGVGPCTGHCHILPSQPTPVTPDQANKSRLSELLSVIGNLLIRPAQSVPPSGVVLAAPALSIQKTGNQVTLNWSLVVGATAYVVERSFNNGTWAALAPQTTRTLTQTLTSAGLYLYRVKGVTSSVTGPASDSVSAQITITTPPADGDATITATYEFDAAAKLFAVRATITPATDVVTLTVEQQNGASITGLGYNFLDVTSGQAVAGQQETEQNASGKVWFFDATENKTGILNPAVKLTFKDTRTNQTAVQFLTLGASGTILSGQWNSNTPPSNVAPSAPASLTVTPVSSTQIDLSWPLVLDIDSYTLQYRLNAQSAWTTISGSLTTNTYSHVGLTPSTTYYYQLKAVDNGLSSPYTAGNAITQAPPADIVAKPQNVVAATQSPIKIRVSWNAVAGATGYVVQRSVDNATWTTRAGALLSTELQYEDTDLSQGTLYYYRVQAKKNSDLSQYSASASATTTMFTITVNGSGTTINIANGATVQLSATTNAGSGYTINWYERALANEFGSPRSVGATYTVTGFSGIGGFRYGAYLKNAAGTIVATSGEVAFSYVVDDVPEDSAQKRIFAELTYDLVTDGGGSNATLDMRQNVLLGVTDYVNGTFDTNVARTVINGVTGVEAVNLAILWDEGQTGPNTFDYTTMDSNIRYYASKGIKVFAMIGCARTKSTNNGVVPAGGWLVDSYGVEYNMPGGTAMISLDHPGARAKAIAWVTAVTTHLNNTPDLKAAVFGISITTTGAWETGYISVNIDPATNQERSVEYDRNPAAMAKMYERIQQWFPNIADLNTYLGGTNYTQYTQYVPEGLNQGVGGYGFPNRNLWYAHRHQGIKDFFQDVYTAIAAINTTWNRYTQFSMIEGNDSPKVATSGGPIQTPSSVMGMKTNPSPGQPLNLMVELLERERGGEWWMAEIDGLYQGTQAENDLISQGRDLIQKGASMVVLANFVIPGSNGTNQQTTDSIGRLQRIIDGMKTVRPNGMVPARRPAGSRLVFLSLKNFIGKGYQAGESVGEYNTVSNNGNLGTKVRLQNDIINPAS